MRSHLLVLAHADEHRAAEVLATLRRFDMVSSLETRNVAYVVRRTDWSVSVHSGSDVGSSAPAPSAFWDLLVSRVLLIPGAAKEWGNAHEYGIAPEFVGALGAALPPGSSAVLLIVPARAVPQLAGMLARFGGTVLQTPISHAGVLPCAFRHMVGHSMPRESLHGDRQRAATGPRAAGST